MPAQVEPAILPAQASHEYSLSQLSDGLAKAPLQRTVEWKGSVDESIAPLHISELAVGSGLKELPRQV